MHGFRRMRKKCFLYRSLTAAAEAGAQNKPMIATLKALRHPKSEARKLNHPRVFLLCH